MVARAWTRWVRFVGGPEEEAWQRDRLYKIATLCLLLQHLMVIACGALWLVSPSGSIDAALDPMWSGGWSLMFVLFAGAGAVARFRRAWPIEAACNIVVAVSVWLWAMVILVVTLNGDFGGLQTSFMLLAFAASLWGWSLTQIAWVRRRESEGARLRAAVAAELERRLRASE